MKLTPFAILYGGLQNPNAILSSVATVVHGLVAELNAAIAEINTNFANYGYALTPNLPTLPAVPTPGSTSPQAIAYFQSTSPGGARPDNGPSASYLLIDAFTANGYADPQAALDILTAETTLVNILLARAVLTTAAAIAITVQPTPQTINNAAAGAIALTATGAGATYEWFMKLPASAYFQRVNANAVFSTVQTTSLTITNPPLATYNQAKFRGVVRSVSGVQQLVSNTVILTVT